jgi:hypothetical protein
MNQTKPKRQDSNELKEKMEEEISSMLENILKDDETDCISFNDREISNLNMSSLDFNQSSNCSPLINNEHSFSSFKYSKDLQTIGFVPNLRTQKRNHTVNTPQIGSLTICGEEIITPYSTQLLHPLSENESNKTIRPST